MTTYSRKRIHRFDLPINELAELQLPRRAKVLSVATPRTLAQDTLDLWALVDPEQPLEPRAFRVVGTGHPIPADAGAFVGTVPTDGGSGIWHVFEVSA